MFWRPICPTCPFFFSIFCFFFEFCEFPKLIPFDRTDQIKPDNHRFCWTTHYSYFYFRLLHTLSLPFIERFQVWTINNVAQSRGTDIVRQSASHSLPATCREVPNQIANRIWTEGYDLQQRVVSSNPTISNIDSVTQHWSVRLIFADSTGVALRFHPVVARLSIHRRTYQLWFPNP